MASRDEAQCREIQRAVPAWERASSSSTLGLRARFSQASEALAREVGSRYDDAGRLVLARSLSGERVYLADDGHWSQAGSDAIAAVLARDGS